MDPITSQGLLYSDSALPAESDNFPNGLESNGSRESLNPTRPSSRLGFNRAILSPSPSDTPSESEAVQWSHSLFQTVGISNLRLSSIKPLSQANAAEMVPEPTTQSVGEQDDNPSTPSDSAPVYGHVSDNLSRSLVVSRPSPKNPRPSVSRLCFPFVTTSPRHKKASTRTPTSPPPPRPPPTPRHKHSCFPSLMSPSSSGRSFPKLQRHNYRQHGYSRMALEQVKWFWSTRAPEREGASTPASLGLDDSPIGHSLPPMVYSSSPVAPVADTSLSAEATPSTLPPMSVHPRRGDIKALRDPYAVHIDRAFVDVPTWTIGKALWMSELHVATNNLAARSESGPDDDVFDGDSDSELDASATASSDDSDATLVESEGENDLPAFCSSKPLSKDLHLIATSDLGYSSTASLQRTTSDMFGERKSVEIDNWLQSVVSGLYIPPSKPSLSRKRKWTVNWYQRWELLVALSRHNQDRKKASSEVLAPPLVVRPMSKYARRYLLPASAGPDDTS